MTRQPAQAVPCAGCGTPTRSKYGVCAGTPECRRERKRCFNEAHREEKRAADAAYRAANRDLKKKQNAAYYQANLESLREASRARKLAWREANPEAVRVRKKADRAAERERWRRRRQRNDLPCAYAKFGCANLKVRNSHYCRSHRKAAERRRLKRQQQAMKRRRAQAQGWACTWCGLPLPADLGDMHQDHVIPRAVTMVTIGRIVNDEWNIDILHPACNRAKGTALTSRAIALAAAHGINLVAAAA